MNENAALPVALTFDLDPDHFDPSQGESYGSDVLAWRGVEIALPALAAILANYTDDFGGRACATWLPRVDDQINILYGDAGAMLDRFAPLLHDRAVAGDEIGWHPHLHRRANGAWVQETDPNALARAMTESHQALTKRGWTPRAIRIGGNYGCNELMSILDRLEIEVDSSAMPGRARNDHHYEFDWSTTPRTAYRPSVNDYRVPGMPARAVVEVPVTMTEVRADYDDRPYARYVDLSFHPRALQPGLEAMLRTAPCLVADTHPSTVLPEAAEREHGLLSYSFDAFRSNLDAILAICADIGRPVRFVTLSDPGLRVDNDTF